jgi:hypothetical protein
VGNKEQGINRNINVKQNQKNKMWQLFDKIRLLGGEEKQVWGLCNTQETKICYLGW